MTSDILRIYKKPTFLLVALLLIGCQYSEDRSISRRVGTRELIGEWMINDYGIQDLIEGGFESPLRKEDFTLSLSDEGQCEMDSVLDYCVHPGEGPPERISPNWPCRWTLEARDQYQTVTLVFDAESRTIYHSLYITEEDGKLILFFYVCDPDRWDYVEYELVSEGQTPG